MKKTGIGWTLLAFITFIFLCVDDSFPENYVLIVKTVCIIGVCAIVYWLVLEYEKGKEQRILEKQNGARQIEEYLKMLKEEQENILTESNRKLSDLIEKLESEHSQVVVSLTEKNAGMFEEAMSGFQEFLRQENENRNMIYENIMNEMKRTYVIQEELVSKEKEVKDLNEEILRDINTAMDKFVQVSGTVRDEVTALKAHMKVFKDKIESKLEEHYERIEDTLEDGNEELQQIMDKSGKTQKNTISEQTSALTDCIDQIEVVINKSINKVLERNDRLLEELDKLQDEWTSLNKNEIEFLNRIWEEQ